MTLTKVQKSDREDKQQLIELVRTKATEHAHIYLFQVDNMRNVVFKQLRVALGSKGRFLIGKNKVMALALGRTDAAEIVPGASQLAEILVGDVGLLFTDLDMTQVQQLLSSIQMVDYARTGSTAAMNVVVCAPSEDDPVGLRNMETGEAIPASCETQLRAAGMPTKLRGGAITLPGQQDYVVCNAGDVLTSDQARILKIMGVRMANFAVNLKAHLFEGNLSLC